MIAERVVIAILTGPGRERSTAALRVRLEACGASVRVGEPGVPLRESTEGADAIVVDVGADPGALGEVARSLSGAPDASGVPRALIVAPTVSAGELAAFGPALVLAGGVEFLDQGVVELVTRARARRSEVTRRAELEARLALLTKRLTRLGSHGSAFAHDARSLLGVVIGFGSNLRDGFSGPVDATQTKHLASLVAAATDATALVDRHAASLTALAQEVEREERLAGAPERSDPGRRLVDIGELVAGSAAILEGIAAGKGIAMHVTTEPMLAWCDPVLVKQAVVNLLTNALKFTPRGGSIEVAALRRTPPSGRGRASRVEADIYVTDTGPGVPASERQRVFERGVRLARDASVPGSGLGLAVVRDVARAHGGAVRVEDGPGGGAAFVLSLPLDLRSREDDAPPSSAEPT